MYKVFGYIILFANINGIALEKESVGPGVYKVLNINQCENTDDHLFIVKAEVRSLSRTQNALNVNLELKTVLDETFALNIDICGHTKDGCQRDELMVTHPSFVEFLRTNAPENTEKFLKMAGINPPDFPLQPGNLTVKGFILDDEDLPETGLYGEHRIHTTLLKIDKVVGCFEVIVDFTMKS